jgi:hypothetical protein
MFFLLGNHAGGGGTLARFVLSCYPAARMTKAGGGVPVDNDTIEAMLDASGAAADATQATAGQRPTVQSEPNDGVLTVVFASDDHLDITPGGDVQELVFVIGAATSGEIFAIDTSATTDKPALIVDVIESV